METVLPRSSIKYSYTTTAGKWILGLLFGLILLLGRYRWTAEESTFSWRSYLMSAYMLVATLPTFYYLLRSIIKRTRAVRLIFFSVAIWFVLPYQWMGLDHWYYNLNHPTFFVFNDPTLPIPQLDWFPQAFGHLGSIPYEAPYFIGITLLGIGIAIAYLQIQNGRSNELEDDRIKSRTRKVIFWLAVYLLIIFQTWLHLSMRSSTVYVAHFTLPSEKAFWYHVYLFPEAQGAVNQEYPAWRALEENFMGVGHPDGNRMMARSFTFYVTSQWSYFFPPYYVYLTRNVLMWFAACLAVYQLGRFWRYPEAVNVFFASLVSFGPGFIAFASDPAGYLPEYAIVAILLFLFEALIVRPSDRNKKDESGAYILFGCILGLSSMMYEIFPLYIFFLGYGIYRRRSFPRLLMCCGLSLMLYFGFSLAQQYGPGVVLEPVMQPVMEQSLHNIQVLLTRPDFGRFYGVTVSFLRHYVGDLGNAFFVLPVLLAFGGLCLLQDLSKGIPILWLAVSTSLTVAFLHWGGPNLASDNPRFAYVAYPMIYLLTAVTISGLAAWLVSRGRGLLGRAVPWVLLLCMFVFNNMDVLGYPQTYFYFWLNNFIFNK